MIEEAWKMFERFNEAGSELYVVHPAPVGIAPVGIVDSWHPLRVWPTYDQDGTLTRLGFRVVCFGLEWLYDQHSSVRAIDVSSTEWEGPELMLHTQDVPLRVTPLADQDSADAIRAWRARLKTLPAKEVRSTMKRLLERFV